MTVDFILTEALEALLNHPDYEVLKRVPTSFTSRINTDQTQFLATIIDLETMGLDARQHEIIELGLLSFSFSTANGILEIVNTYNELNDPGKPIPPEITKVTGITDADVKGKRIDWSFIETILRQSHLIICHNSGFDRNFLEKQTPITIQSIVKNLPFACTLKDISWKDRGYESSKLDYLNWKMGFFYKGHRALLDCWATLNLLLNEAGSFEELKRNVRKKETLLCAENAPFDKKDLLKARSYRWSDGAGKLPKCWWSFISHDQLSDEKQWLDEEIYGIKGASDKLPQAQITARRRYSFRAEEIFTKD